MLGLFEYCKSVTETRTKYFLFLSLHGTTPRTCFIKIVNFRATWKQNDKYAFHTILFYFLIDTIVLGDIKQRYSDSCSDAMCVKHFKSVLLAFHSV